MPSRTSQLARAALVVFVGFLASRALGLVRNMVVLSQFGTSREYEAFVAAIQVPDLVFQVLAGGAVAAAFIPVFKSSWISSQRQAWRIASSAINLALLATGAVALALAFLAGPLADVLVPGWDPPSRELTARLMRSMLVSPVLFAASAFAASILNAFQRFALAAAAPLVYNLSIIAGVLLLREPLGVYSLAVGVVAGAALHLLVQVPGLVRAGMRYAFLVDLAHPGVRAILQLMLPRMLGLGVTQLNLLINLLLASFLAAGSVGFLSVAWLVLMSQVAVAMAIGTAVFPTLAEASASREGEELRRIFYLALRGILFLSIPAAVGLVVLGEPLVRVFFERGEFTPESTRRTAYALTFYALGLAGHGVIEIADRLFYSLRDTATPVLAACGATALNLLLSLLLMHTTLDYGGLALANSLAALAEAGALVYLLRQRLPRLDLDALAAGILRILAASLLMGSLVLPLRRGIPWFEPEAGLALQLLALVGVASLGAAAYLAIAAALRCEELRLLRLALRAG